MCRPHGPYVERAFGAFVLPRGTRRRAAYASAKALLTIGYIGAVKNPRSVKHYCSQGEHEA